MKNKIIEFMYILKIIKEQERPEILEWKNQKENI